MGTGGGLYRHLAAREVPARRARAIEAIADGVAILQGAVDRGRSSASVRTVRSSISPAYHNGTRRLAPGELVQFGYAPDSGYDVSDVTRVFPGDKRSPPGSASSTALQVPEEGLAMRLEDALLVTGHGYEVLSAFVPLDIDPLERLMREPGITGLIDRRK